MKKLLKHTSAAERLAMVLEEFRSSEISAYGSKAGISAFHLAQAMSGRLNATVPYLRLAAAMDYDPTEGQWPFDQPKPIGDFDFVMLAMGLRLRRALNDHTEGQAAKDSAIGLGHVQRLERGDSLCIGSILRACSYIQIHVFGYIRQAEKIGKYRRSYTSDAHGKPDDWDG